MNTKAACAAFSMLWLCCQLGLGQGPTKHREVPSFGALSKLYPLPGAKRIFLQQPGDYKIVEARPDLKFQMKDATAESLLPTGFGFVLVKGDKPESFDFQRTEQRLVRNSLPLLTQRVAQAGFVFQQTAFTTEDAAARRIVMVRLQVSRENDSSPRALTLAWLSVRAPHALYHSHPNEDYIVFEPWSPGWETSLGLRCDKDVQHDGETIFDAFRHSDNVSIVAGGPITGALGVTIDFVNCREAVIEVMIPYEGLPASITAQDRESSGRKEKTFKLKEKERLMRLSFGEEFARQTARWEQRLNRAARIRTPEALVLDVYRTLTLNDLQFLGSSPGVAYYKPGQGGFNSFAVVYGWESSHFLTVMDAQGFHDEVRRVLDYFLTTQQGSHGPSGDISTAEGCFRPHIHWMCETGSILGIFAQHALCSGDWAGLRRDSPALLKAARWIAGQRARTKLTAAGGEKVLHYGLMPAGRATDWPQMAYAFFTDAYTWQGLDRLARAYELARLPEAAWLRQQSDDYRNCILQALRRSLKPHPFDPALKWVPSDIYEDPIKVQATTIFEGPRALIGAGVLPSDDPLIPMIESSLRRAGSMSDWFGFRMRTMEDADLKQRQEQSAGGKVDLYYVNDSERIWHRTWLERGERIKALRYFYMTLAYSTSRDVHVTHERYCPQLPWLLPWQPNASGNGRILSMILDTLCFEKRDGLHLLYGVPDAWFAAKQPLGLTGLRTSFGALSFRLKPGNKPGSYDFTYECDKAPPPRLFIAIPSAEGAEMRRIVEIACKNRGKGTFVIE
jgi:hypothetical protein